MRELKNDLLLRALEGREVERPPVWMMRQAGRYLPDYMKLREKYTFFERVTNPALATEITVMPVEQIGVDAAILFCDILVIPQAMGIEVQMISGKGPYLPDPVRNAQQIDRLSLPAASEALGYVMTAIQHTLDALDGKVPLIGFAGAPWTIFCYMVEGQGARGFYKAREFAFCQPRAAHTLLDKITSLTVDYLRQKFRAGVHAVQLFDSWGGILSPEDFRRFSLPYLKRIVGALREDEPVIIFAKGCGLLLPELAQTGATALSVDWTISPKTARKLAGENITLQGNLDPARLLSPPAVIEKETRKMAEQFGRNRYIANLGHGILPNIPVEHARAFVRTIQENV